MFGIALYCIKIANIYYEGQEEEERRKKVINTI
jgi:hypothetical protein